MSYSYINTTIRANKGFAWMLGVVFIGALFALGASALKVSAVVSPVSVNVTPNPVVAGEDVTLEVTVNKTGSACENNWHATKVYLDGDSSPIAEETHASWTGTGNVMFPITFTAPLTAGAHSFVVEIIGGGEIINDVQCPEEIWDTIDGSFDVTEPEVPGCMDSDATNHDPEATEDDGSCEYGAELIGVASCAVDGSFDIEWTLTAGSADGDTVIARTNWDSESQPLGWPGIDIVAGPSSGYAAESGNIFTGPGTWGSPETTTHVIANTVDPVVGEGKVIWNEGEEDEYSQEVMYSVNIPEPCGNGEPTATVITQKFICEDESDLPNYGAGGPDITETLLNEWLADEEDSCEPVKWDFQWEYEPSTNPGDNTGAAGGGWSAPFSGSVEIDISNISKVWIREVFDPNYIEFTGQNTSEDVSAELYCHTDVLHYDNWEWVDGMVDGGEYYCIAWNVPVEGEQCVEGPTWADSVVSSDQGTRKNGSAVLPLRTNPDNVLGEPDGNGAAGTGFFSLGVDGTITVEFDHYIENVVGDDLSFHEITNGRTTYPEELADVEVSQDGVYWEYIGTVSSKAAAGVDYLDFDSTGWSWIKFVRITDVTDFGPHSADADGYDIDAIDATNGLCKEPQPECIIEGYKYDEEGQPLEGWTIGLGMWPQLEFAASLTQLVVIEEELPNGGSVVGTDETDENGYYCIVSDEDLPKNYWYEAYEIIQDGWTDIGYEIEGGEMQDLYPGSDSFDDHFFTNNINEYLFGDNVLPIQIDFYNTGELSCDPDVNFIQNGGFETPSVTLAQGWELFAGGGPLVWLVDWMTGGAGNIELHGGVNGWLPYEGEQYAELDTHGNAPGSNVKIYQNLATEDGEEYALSFAFSPRPGTSAADNEFEVWWNGNLLDTLSADGSANSNTDWEVHTYTGLDGDESSTLEFRAIGTQNTLGTFLDDIALYCVPKSGGDDKKGSITIIKQDVSNTDEEFEFTSRALATLRLATVIQNSSLT